MSKKLLHVVAKHKLTKEQAVSIQGVWQLAPMKVWQLGAVSFLYVQRNPFGTRFYFKAKRRGVWIQIWRFELRWLRS